MKLALMNFLRLPPWTHLPLELIFVALVILDGVLTHKCIRSKKGREVGAGKWSLMPWIIKHPILAYAITIAGVGVIFVLIETSGFFSLYIPINAAFAWACWNSWRILHG